MKANVVVSLFMYVWAAEVGGWNWVTLGWNFVLTAEIWSFWSSVLL